MTSPQPTWRLVRLTLVPQWGPITGVKSGNRNANQRGTVWLCTAKSDNWKAPLVSWLFTRLCYRFLHNYLLTPEKSSRDPRGEFWPPGWEPLLYLACPGCVSLNIKKVDKISSPWRHLYLTFLCPLLTAPTNKQTRVQRSWTASSPQCQRKSPGSSPLLNPTEIKHELTKKKDSHKKGCQTKCSPVTQTLLFLVQTSSCNFILESLWIPGTSILRYSIYRLNYESKLYQYVKILYVQLNCSMLVHWVVYALLLQDDYADEC